MSLNLNKALAGKYLKASDIPKGATVNYQINDIEMMDLSQNKDGSEQKPVMTFVNEGAKPLPLNKTNIMLVTSILGPDPEDYLGKLVGIYHDPTVQNPGGQMVGGLRICKPADNDIPI